jgi:DNA-binding CsgD family transcriptional regulator
MPSSGVGVTERLGQRDLSALQECVATLYELGGLDGLQRRILQALPAVIPADVSAFCELDLRRRTVAWNLEASARFGLRDAPSIFAAHMTDLPWFKSYRRGEGSAVKISDSLTRRQFHRTAIYNEFYRPIGIEYHIAKGLPGAPDLVTAIGLVRRRKDFSERDRLLLNLLRPHLNQSYRNAMAISRVHGELALLREGVEALEQGLVILARSGRVAAMSGRARRLLAEYLGEAGTGALPETLRQWVRRCDEKLASRDDAVPPREPFRVTRDGRQLSVRLVSDGDRRVLLLSEAHDGPRSELLASLGLSRREAQVLVWVAKGKANAEIATILGTSARTVDKHLEHIFRKLGVESRTAAVAHALSVLPA